jgi:hypothetical protein
LVRDLVQFDTSQGDFACCFPHLRTSYAKGGTDMVAGKGEIQARMECDDGWEEEFYKYQAAT